MIQIKTLKHLRQLSLKRRAVICPSKTDKPMPATFVLSMQGFGILAYFERGLFVYEKKKND